VKKNRKKVGKREWWMEKRKIEEAMGKEKEKRKEKMKSTEGRVEKKRNVFLRSCHILYHPYQRRLSQIEKLQSFILHSWTVCQTLRREWGVGK
jgi:hypothetical protein